MSSNKGIVNNEESLIAKLEEIRAAQVKFAEYTQEQVDKIFLAAATAANNQRVPLVEDKVR